MLYPTQRMLLNVHLDILKLLFYSNLSDVIKVADLASSNVLSARIKCRVASVQVKLKQRKFLSLLFYLLKQKQTILS